MRTPPFPEVTCGFPIQLVFCKKKTMWFIGAEVEQETSAPPPKKNPGSAPAEEELSTVNENAHLMVIFLHFLHFLAILVPRKLAGFSH